MLRKSDRFFVNPTLASPFGGRGDAKGERASGLIQRLSVYTVYQLIGRLYSVSRFTPFINSSEEPAQPSGLHRLSTHRKNPRSRPPPAVYQLIGRTRAAVRLPQTVLLLFRTPLYGLFRRQFYYFSVHLCMAY